MLKSLLLWRITKTAYLSALVMAFIVFAVQIFRLGFVLFGLPLESSIPFFVVWFVFYGFYFLPDGVLLATATTAYDLKEKKLLHVLYSFQFSSGKVLQFFLIPVSILFILSSVFSYILVEEHVGFLTRGLLIQYKDRIFENIPVKTFLDAGNLVVYVRDKEGNTLKDIFLKYKNIQVIAKRARYEGSGRFVFEKGSLLTEERGKYFLMKFDTYRLDTEEYLVAKISERVLKRDRILNAINTLSILPLALFAYFGSIKLCKSHTHLYVLITIGLVLHQIILFGFKVSL